MQTKSIMIVDDHPLVRSGLRQLLESVTDLKVCCEAAGIHEALRFYAQHLPDLAIIDLSLPDGNGLDLIKRLLIKNPEFPILVSSMYDEDLFAVRSLNNGAKGYISKQEIGAKVIYAVRQIFNGKVYLNPSMSRHHLSAFSANAKHQRQDTAASLSTRELEVFELIGHGVATSEIANRLNLSIKTIESHRAHIKSKLKIHTAGELTRKAVQWSLDGYLTFSQEA